jgi:hypothetical protein
MLRDNIHLENKIPLDFIGDSEFINEPIKNSFQHYGAYVSESVLTLLLPIMEKTVGKKLLPTYSYARIYYTGSSMERHTDRPSCEYSATICISADPEPWEIGMKGYTGEESYVNLNPGDICIYSGTVVEHWRNEYKGKKQVQFFIHTVDANGMYADHIYDGRVMLGSSKSI